MLGVNIMKKKREEYLAAQRSQMNEARKQKEQSRIYLDKTVNTKSGCCGSKRETKSTPRRTKKSEYCSFNRRTDSIVGETLPQSILIPANNKSLKKQKTNTNTTISSHDVTPMNIPISDSEEKM